MRSPVKQVPISEVPVVLHAVYVQADSLAALPPKAEVRALQRSKGPEGSIHTSKRYFSFIFDQ
ncbi:hypothetical protein WA026_005343, partial [Henosepilachna vigintioctopunctata]